MLKGKEILTEPKEAFFALIAPIGIDLSIVNEELSEALKIVSYYANEIRLTDILTQAKLVPDKFSNEVSRYQTYIDEGDKLVRKAKKKDFFSLYGIARVLQWSREKYPDKKREDEIPTRVVHIFRQLKRVDEIKTLERIYGRNILYLGCYASKKDRTNYLVNKMLKTQRGENKSKLESEALAIISTDEDERDKPHGQKIIDCYPYADFIIDCSSRASIKKSCRRLIEIFFGQPFISPNEDEYCSYIANAASYRSLDLSRQVGAAIFGDDCEIIAMGCNEVPKAGGGTYWANENHDHRDYTNGYDSNQKVREDLTRDVLSRLNDNGWISEEYKALTADEMVTLVFEKGENKNGPFVGSMVSDIIEYGRMVHAEMNALADAARFRKSTQGATLFCTTMPCHMCAKLIVAAGIKRVVYLQPYGKSLVEELYPDSISLDGDDGEGKVDFETLKGVTPNGFKRAFHKTQKRKNRDGSAIRWHASEGVPNFLSTFPYYVPLESRAVLEFQSALKAAEIDVTK